MRWGRGPADAAGLDCVLSRLIVRLVECLRGGLVELREKVERDPGEPKHIVTIWSRVPVRAVRLYRIFVVVLSDCGGPPSSARALPEPTTCDSLVARLCPNDHLCVATPLDCAIDVGRLPWRRGVDCPVGGAFRRS